MDLTRTARIAERPLAGRPLGRHVQHDPRSRGFAIRRRPTLASRTWLQHCRTGPLESVWRAVTYWRSRVRHGGARPWGRRGQNNSAWNLVTGLTPSAYVRRRRLDEAERLLRAGLTVEVTALQVGYSNASALVFALRRERGLGARSIRRRR